MHITLLTYGSRGDVQPFVALALGLQQAGHTVRLAAPHRFADFAAEYGIPFAPLPGDPEAMSAAFNDARGNIIAIIRAMNGYVSRIAPQVAEAAFAACDDADLIVHSFLFTTGAHSLARARGLPDVSVQFFPVFAPTRAFPNVAASYLPPGALSVFSTSWRPRFTGRAASAWPPRRASTSSSTGPSRSANRRRRRCYSRTARWWCPAPPIGPRPTST